MKAKAEHRVPLSTAAMALLKALKPKEPQPGDLIFAAGEKGLSNMSLLMCLRRMKVEVTTHGFRSTFRDWCGDEAGYPRELAEAALAHTIQSKSERAYRRGTAVELRRPMMEAWADFLEGAEVAALAA
jgi:integrase